MRAPAARPLARLALALLAPALASAVAACADDGPFAVGHLGALVVLPERVQIELESVPFAETREVPLDLHNVGDGPLTVLSFALVDARGEPVPDTVLGLVLPATPLVLEPSAHAAATVVYTRHDDTARDLELHIATTNPDVPTTFVPIAIEAGVGHLLALPSEAHFPLLGGASVQPIALLNTGSAPVRLGRLDLDAAPGFHAELEGAVVDDVTTSTAIDVTVAPSRSVTIAVTFVPADTLPVRGTLRVFGSSPDTRDGLAIGLFGNDDGPCVRVRPPLIDHGDKPAGAVSEIAAEIESCGTEPVAVTAVALADADDAADPELRALGVDAPSSPRLELGFDDPAPTDAAPWSLAPGETRRVVVRYRAAPASEVGPGQRVEDAGFVLVRSRSLVPVRVVPVVAATVRDGTPLSPRCELLPDPAPPSVDPLCASLPQGTDLEAKVEWHHGDFEVEPTAKQVMMAPVVGNLTDDDGDGHIGGVTPGHPGDIPDIVVTRFYGSSYGSAGVLTALSGDDGHELWSIFGGTSDVEPLGIGGVALGDIDADGEPDVCAETMMGIACWEVAPPGVAAAPTLRWKATGCAPAPYPMLGRYPSIADVDGDGAAEVLFHGCVFSAAGAKRWSLPTGVASPIPFAADLDDDPRLEVVDGGRVFDLPAADGQAPTLLWDLGFEGGYAAVADFDGDGRPEVVATSYAGATLRLFDPDGATDPDSVDGFTLAVPESTYPSAGGPPTVADLDGLPGLEIGIASELAYLAFDATGKLLWSTPITDASSRTTGSAVFDFDGDGAAEIVYADELDLYVLDGATGEVRVDVVDHASGTGLDYPVIADVDRDGRAEVVLGSNNYYRAGWNGVTVLGSARDAWRSADPVWNQHAFSVTNVGPDLAIPARAEPSWEHWNTFRAAAWDDGPRPDADPLVAAVGMCPATCDADARISAVRVRVVVGNGGPLAARDVRVALRRGSPTGPEVAAATVAEATPGTNAAVELTVSQADWGADVLYATVAAATGTPVCDPSDDSREVGPWPGAAAGPDAACEP